MPAMDTDYEQNFFQIAMDSLKDQAPALVPHFVAFQLIEKSDDDTRGIGAFYFKVGDENLICPVMFLNGELKGKELMLQANDDMMVSLTEERVEHVMRRKTHVLGAPESRPRERLGIRQPDFSVFSRPPLISSKMGSEAPPRTLGDLYGTIPAEFHPALDLFRRIPGEDPEMVANDKAMDLGNAFPLLGKRAVLAFFDTCLKFPDFADAALKFYSHQDLIKAAEKAKVEYDDTPFQPKGKPTVLVVLRNDDPPGDGRDLSDSEKERIIRDGYSVRDGRNSVLGVSGQEAKDGKPTLYPAKMNWQFQSPDGPGVWEVLTPDAKIREMLVTRITMRVGEYSRPDQEVGCSVIDRAAGTAGSFRTNDVLARRKVKSLDELLPSLSDPKRLASGDRALLCGPGGAATNIFWINEVIRLPDGSVQLGVSASCGASAGSFARPGEFEHALDGKEKGLSLVGAIVLTDREDGYPQHIGRSLFLPKTFKAVKIGEKFNGDANGNLLLGGVNHLDGLVVKAAEVGAVLPLRAETVAGRTEILFNGKRRESFTKGASVRHLMTGVGMSEGQADEVLHLASLGPCEILVKMAETPPPDPAVFWEPSPEFEGNTRYPTRYPWANSQVIGRNNEGEAREKNRIDPWFDESTLQFARDAAGQGRKELFDASAITGMAKAVDVTERINEMLPVLRRAVDKLGRNLLMFYWHADKYRSLYGSQQMTSLEDNTRNVFKTLDQLVLDYEAKAGAREPYGDIYGEEDDGGQTDIEL